MMARAYYNEFDPFCAQWLRNMIAAGHIPQGDVDERSIVEVQPGDLAGYTQCHFFAGIGGWALAARLAGWPDARELWSGSCPCQPYSHAGKQKGHADERHLYPEFYRLICARRPAVVVGEQVAAAIGFDWLDRVFLSLEDIDYATWACVLPACAVDAPHRRERLWFVGNRDGAMGDGQRARLEGHAGDEDDAWRWAFPDRSTAAASRSGVVGHAGSESQHRGVVGSGVQGSIAVASARPADTQHASRRTDLQTHWSDARWVVGHDGKGRRVKPGVRLLADGFSERVGKLRAYGNAIVPQEAAEILGAILDCSP